MKSLLLFVLSFSSLVSFASYEPAIRENFICVFYAGENHFIISYNHNEAKMMLDGALEEEVLSNSAVVGYSETPIQVFGDGGKLVLKLTHDKKGSDGRTKDVYPYSAEYVGGPTPVTGGCLSASELPVQAK